MNPNLEFVESENWRMFRKRGPVSFTTPKSMACRLNRMCLPFIEREEFDLLRVAKSVPEWNAVCDQISARLLRPAPRASVPPPVG